MSMDIKEKSEFQLIDIMKLIAAFLVIGLHTRPFLSVNRLADNLYVYDIACYAVPFFYACTGYFIYQFSQRNHDMDLQIKKRIYKIFKIYVFWTIMYMPLTIYGWNINSKGLLKNIVIFFRNFLFVGENYYSWTLWYLNGLIVALALVYFFHRKITIKSLVLLSSCFYLFGYMLEIFNINLSRLPSYIGFIISCYFKIFSTTRNGLFRAFVFVTIGIYVGNIVKTKKNGIARFILLAVILYVIKLILSVSGGGQRKHQYCIANA